MSFYGAIRGIAGFLLWFPFKLEVEQRADWKPEQGYILAANHQSFMDPIFLALAIKDKKRRVSYMAKEELFRVPVLKSLIKKLGAFPVARGTGDTGAIDHAVDVVKNGGMLGIFPEGTRHKDGKLHRLKSGAVVVASRTGGDLIPACILYGKRKFIRKPVKVIFGEPIENASLGLDGISKSALRASNRLLGERIAELMGVEAP